MLTSLRGRLLFLVCLATLPSLLFTFSVAHTERVAALSRMEADALHFANLVSREHSSQIQGASELLRWLGKKVVSEQRRSQIFTDPNFLQALLAGHPQLANIGVLSPEGSVLQSAYTLASYESWERNPAYLASLGSQDVVTGTYLISPIFARPTLNHAFAVRDVENRVVAVLFTGLDLAWLSDADRWTRLTEDFSLLVTDREGRVLAHGGFAIPPSAEIGVQWLPDTATLAQSHRGKMVEVPGSSARHYVVVVPLEKALNLFVAVVLPFDRVLGQANSAFYRTLFGLLILTLFTIAALFIATEIGILRGVRSLVRAARQLGAGDLTIRVTPPQQHNELALLAATFNEMASNLAARHREAIDAQDRLRALSNRLQLTREEEAARISRELHDEIGQVLTSLKIDLSRMARYCPADALTQDCAATLRDYVTSVTQQIDVAMDFVRRIAADLRPGVLDKLGLGPAIEWYAREIEARTDLVVPVDLEALHIPVSDVVSVTLFRIFQEALTNVVRHAEATLVEVHLAAKDGDLMLRIRDDGKGISVESIQSDASLGIVGMRERALLIRGRLSVEGAPGKGTTVIVTVPLQNVTEAGDERADCG